MDQEQLLQQNTIAPHLSLNVQPAQAPQPARSPVSRASRGLQDLQAPARRLQVYQSIGAAREGELSLYR